MTVKNFEYYGRMKLQNIINIESESRIMKMNYSYLFIKKTNLYDKF